MSEHIPWSELDLHAIEALARAAGWDLGDRVMQDTAGDVCLLAAHHGKIAAALSDAVPL